MREGRSSGTVTVLFTDLVGSTALLLRLGDVGFDDVRRNHVAALRNAIGRAAGEEVKSTGDGLMAVFGTVADAVRCAIAMQQATHRQARSAQAPLAIRVGLSVGDVTFEDGDVFGAPVVEAARLVAAAGPGEILTTQVARALAGRAATQFVDVEPLQLKGLVDPVPASQVLWEALAETSIPLPALLTDLGRIFVGRDAELEQLGQLWKEAAAGERRVAMLAGEPGVGKTRLAAELAARLHEENAVVLAGRCDEDLGVPYQPFVEALRHFADHLPTEDLGGRLGRFGGELVRLVPELAELVAGLSPTLSSDPETERYRLFDAVGAWLAAASNEEPMVLVLDDLQWAAKPTLLLLRHVLRSPGPMRLLVVGTYRDTDVGRAHPLSDFLADVRRQHGFERLSLVGLDATDVVAFLKQAAGHELDAEGEQLAHVVWQETEGNPFFVTEVLRHLTESGALQYRGGRWVATAAVADIGIPEGVRDVVGRRLSRLSENANRVLACASLIGLEFDSAVVQQAGQFGEDAVLSALEEAVVTRLVVDVTGRRSRFAHALVRDTLYDELAAPRRTALHRRAAEAIETIHAAALDDHLPALAYHWARASAPAVRSAKALDYARRAGDRALAQFANDEAASYYRQGLEFLEAAEARTDDRTRVALLISLGEAERRAGDPAHRKHLLDAARLAHTQGDAQSLARAALANSRGSFSSAGQVDAERIRVLELAIEAIGDRHDASRARLLATLAMELTWGADLERRTKLSDEAVALPRRVGDLDVLNTVLHSRASAIWDASTVSDRLDVTAEALTIAERTDDPLARFWSLFRRFVPLLESGSVEDAAGHATTADEVSDGLGQPFLRMLAKYMQATLLVVRGRLADAEQMAHTARAFGEQAGQPDTPLFFAIQMFYIRYEQGQLDDAVAAQLASFTERFPSVTLTRAMVALIELESGRLDDAREAFDPVALHGFTDTPRDNAWSPTMGIGATVCSGLGDAQLATVLYDLIEPYEDLVSAHLFLWLGAFNHHLATLDATLGRFAAAAERFAAAASTHGRAGARCSQARTQLEWGRMLLTRRRPTDMFQARELLSQALGTARELGLAGVERRAVELLQ